MALVTVNGKDAISMKLEIPRVGAWHADMKVDSVSAISSPVSVVVGDGVLVLNGAVARGGVFADAADIRIVGGAGRLNQLATPRHYVQPTVRSILAHLLGDAGEMLSPTVSAAILNRHLDFWTTVALPGGAIIARLCATLGAGYVWRILPAGTFWLGVETWPDSGLRDLDDYQTIVEYPEAGYAILGVEAPRLLPGTTLGGRRVSRVEHDVGETTRTRVWYEDVGAATDRSAEAWAGALGGSVVDTFYRGNYVGDLIQQDQDVVDVRFKDARLPSMGKVPVFSGVPGLRTKDATGGRVIVSWGGADPSQPRAECFDAGVIADTLVINARNIVLGGESGSEPAAKATTLADWLSSHAHTGVSTGGGTSGPPVSPPPDFAASNVKVK